MNVNQCNGAGSYTWHQVNRKPATPIHDSNIRALHERAIVQFIGRDGDKAMVYGHTIMVNGYRAAYSN